MEELEHSGLARQVSTLLTHHLARATNAIGNAAGGTEALQEVLGLLNNLSRSVTDAEHALLSLPFDWLRPSFGGGGGGMLIWFDKSNQNLISRCDGYRKHCVLCGRFTFLVFMHGIAA